MATPEETADPRPAPEWDDRRQIEFPPLQTHRKSFEAAMLILSFVCVVVVLIIVLGTDLGDEFRPTV
jgi:hypothetical protein